MCDAVGFVSALQHQRVRPNGMAVLPCGELKAGKVTWSREVKGRRVSILSTDNGDIIRHMDNRNHSSLPDLSLLIWFVSSWDEGLYYCNGTPVACLTVKAADGQNQEDLTKCVKGGARACVTERVRMFGGVGLAALTFLSATAAAVKASRSARTPDHTDLYINLTEQQSK
ncbi:mucin-22-like isoform X1 [Labeo rohita]|uniref:Mucin-22-like isoform X1 n=1 Tax=Labeo rohita TaxID=84645 RepID=A0A498MC58_LABRO|nr:mucin-22-like isoform X1 [Labeo rohita]